MYLSHLQCLTPFSVFQNCRRLRTTVRSVRTRDISTSFLPLPPPPHSTLSFFFQQALLKNGFDPNVTTVIAGLTHTQSMWLPMKSISNSDTRVLRPYMDLTPSKPIIISTLLPCHGPCRSKPCVHIYNCIYMYVSTCSLTAIMMVIYRCLDIVVLIFIIASMF